MLYSELLGLKGLSALCLKAERLSKKLIYIFLVTIYKLGQTLTAHTVKPLRGFSETYLDNFTIMQHLRCCFISS